MSGGRAVSARARAAEQVNRSAGEPSLEFAHPVQLQGRRADDDRRVGRVGLDRRECLDRLPEALLVGEERASLGEQIPDSRTLERLELAAEPRTRAWRPSLQRARRARLSARVARGSPAASTAHRAPPRSGLADERVEIGHAERIGAERRQPAVLIVRAWRRARGSPRGSPRTRRAGRHHGRAPARTSAPRASRIARARPAVPGLRRRPRRRIASRRR